MSDTVSFSAYPTIAPPVETTSFQETTSTTTANEPTTTTPSLTDGPETTATTTTASTDSHPYPTTSVSYAQILSGGTVANIPWSNFANSDFDSLCPSHDCVQDCQNYTRLFEEVPYPFTESFETYGKSIDGQPPDTTLFGLCSNLDNIFTGISEGLTPESTVSYFPLQSQDGVNEISSSLASCLTSTCDLSREPQNCIAACNIPALYSNGTNTNLTAVTACLNMICGNTCGLPYANQDVLGVGVLVSYVIQAILILACAIALIFSAAYYTFRAGHKGTKLSNTSRQGLEGFLIAQCYFTVALEIAALCSSPWAVDPLSGYALLSVAITGFLCPVFTLMLLHNRGCRSVYTAGLTILSYILATVVFWTLYANLSRHLGSTTGSDEALRELYQIPTCGGSSAIALCPQTIGNDPLHYLAGFYNQGGIPNLHTMPLLWGWTTFILLLLVFNQARGFIGSQQWRSQTTLKPAWTLIVRIFAHPVALLVACTLFGLCLGYQAEMLRKYSGSDVIDWNGWTFGQVVAVVIWIQPVADYLHSWLHDRTSRQNTSNQQPVTQTKAGYVAVSSGTTPSIGTSNSPNIQQHSMHSRSNSHASDPFTAPQRSSLPTSHTF